MHTKKIISRVLLFFTALLCSFSLFAATAKTTDIYGKPFTASANKKWVVITYWADWCHYCTGEIPDLNEFAAKIKNKPVIFFAVNYDQLPAADQRKFAQEHHMNFTLLRNNPFADLLSDRTIATLPTTFVISPEGKVKQLSGQQTASSILAEIEG